MVLITVLTTNEDPRNQRSSQPILVLFTLYFIICERVMKYNKEGADYTLNKL